MLSHLPPRNLSPRRPISFRRKPYLERVVLLYDVRGISQIPLYGTGFANGFLTFIRWLANFPGQYRLQVLIRLVRASFSILVRFSAWVFMVSIVVSKYTHPLVKYSVSSKPTASFRDSHTYPVVVNWQWAGCFDNYMIPLTCVTVKYILLTAWYPAYLCLPRGGPFCKDVWARSRYRLSAISDYR